MILSSKGSTKAPGSDDDTRLTRSLREFKGAVLGQALQVTVRVVGETSLARICRIYGKSTRGK